MRDEYAVRLRAMMFFGEEWSAQATHEQRIERWNELLRHEWERKGGSGPHPLEE